MSFEIDYELTAPVFNIQSFCIHDGPGIRSTVFVKGCPLRCLWCANPESNSARPELMTFANKCTGCGACVPACPHGAISLGEKDGKVVALTDRKKCVNCGQCAVRCVNDARELSGKIMTVRECVEVVAGDKLFYEDSGGGMTISGGEALAHAEFSAHLFAAAHAEGIHTCIESCSWATRETIDFVYRHIDVALLDVKHMDSETHKKLVGVPNELILDNIRHIHDDLHVPVVLRLPTIPGYNDSEENIRATAAFAASLGEDVRMNLLPFHKLGESKNENLGHPFSLGIEPPSDARMEELKQIVESYGVKAQIGG